MCGILGITSFNIKPNIDKFEESLKLINHRGPDETKRIQRDNFLFGHNRLIVVDKENGKQPMEYDGYTIVYNGELYNSDEIRNKLLEVGYEFNGYSDTEVLLKAYHYFKEECLEQLNGIFAFAIYHDDKIFLARDRVGVKPLYYSTVMNELMFSSEIKPITSYYGMNAITTSGLRELLAMGPSHTLGLTPFDHVLELKPGHYAIYENNNTIKEVRYWGLKAEAFTDSYEDAVIRVRELLTDAVRRQLVGDVPLGTFLSGGIDSSIITAITALEKDDLKSFSIDYEGNDTSFESNNYQVSDDQQYIPYLVEMYKIDNKIHKISMEELEDSLTFGLYYRDYPAMSDIDSSLNWFSRKIKDDVTVCLSGECADEIFAGYPWYRTELGDNFPWFRYLSIREQLLNDEYRDKVKLTEYTKEKFNDIVCDTSLLEGDSTENNNHRIMYRLNVDNFMTTLLDRKDRMTMGASLEVRVPFADHRLIEYLYNVPLSYKMKDGIEKKLLRDSFANLLPNEILNRKKSPYPKTHNKYYSYLVAGKLKEALDDHNSILHVLFKRDEIERLIETKGSSITDPWFGQLMTGPQLIAYLYQFHLFFKLNDLRLV